MSVTNPLVGFLSCYGPADDHDNLYDERVHDALERFGVKEIAIPATRLDDLRLNFSSAEPNHVILTGTAGDGKTYHCRRILEQLSDGCGPRMTEEKIHTVELEQIGKKLVIVKDLSELTPEDKAQVFDGFCPAVVAEESDYVYLIAANDGQLLSSLRSWTRQHGYEELFRIVEQMLVDGREEVGRLTMYNLSRQDPSGDFERIVEAIVEHPQWTECEGCPLYKTNQTEICPIRLNREMLREDGSQKVFRSRLMELLELSNANGLHLPIRHLFLLTVNIILGDKLSLTRLLTCRKAKNRAQDKAYWATNPYTNVFGGNLSDADWPKYQSFTVMNSFGVGRETSNEIDDLLIYGPYRQEVDFNCKVGNDRMYGAGSKYDQIRRNYVEEGREHEDEFLQELVSQRRRLFFTLESSDALQPWSLTVYRSAGQYLEFCRNVDEKIPTASIERKLIRGLNRTFSGMMIEDSRKVYVTFSGGDGRGRISSVLIDELSVGRKNNPLSLGFGPGPEVFVYGEQGSEIERMALRLTHFEYLMRVADGSLPASFSKQCFEDFLDFKTRIIDQLTISREETSEVSFQTIDVQPNGHPLVREVIVPS